MAGNALAILDQQRPQLPAHAQQFFDENKNVQDRITVPSLSYEGKTWSIALDGNKTKLVKRDNDGDEVPVGVMRVVILDYAKRRGRAYYEGAYDPAKPGLPACWSTDGYVPDDDVKEKQSPKCETCPMAAKGSKVTDQGKAATACSQHRMVAVVPSNKIDFTPLRLKLAITSDYDGQSAAHEAEGWFAFSNFTDMLRSKQVQHTGMISTKMKFDANTAYPKVLFSVDRWLEPAELEKVIKIAREPAVTSLLDGSWTPDGINGKPRGGGSPEATGDQPDEPAANAKTTTAAKQQAKETKPKETKAEGSTPEQIEAKRVADEKAAAKAEKATKAKAAAEEAARLAKEAEEDDEDANVVLPDAAAASAVAAKAEPKVETKKVEPKAEAKAATKDQPKASEQPSTAVPSDVADLLADWGGE